MMITKRKRWKRWQKWIVGIAGLFLVFILSITGYLYYQIHSIHLSDIQDRLKQRQLGQDNPSAPLAALPSFLNGSVAKADQFANKPIAAQDALDVASILLKSGLSLEEVYFLIGKSSDKLSNIEKQNIRDLLLSKLTQEEIEALRSITGQYGKGLIILDPNFPIELVGIYNEAERARILKELEAKKKDGKSSLVPTSSPIPTADMKPMETSQTQAAPMTDKQKQIQAQYYVQIKTLQARCESDALKIWGDISSEIQKAKDHNQPVTMKEIQEKYMPKVLQKEQNCDEQFSQLMAQAKEKYKLAGMGLEDIQKWNGLYQQSKNQLKAAAISSMAK